MTGGGVSSLRGSGQRGNACHCEVPTHTSAPIASDNTSNVVARAERLSVQGINPTGNIHTTEPMITHIAVSAGSPRHTTPYPLPPPLIPHTNRRRLVAPTSLRLVSDTSLELVDTPEGTHGRRKKTYLPDRRAQVYPSARAANSIATTGPKG